MIHRHVRLLLGLAVWVVFLTVLLFFRLDNGAALDAPAQVHSEIRNALNLPNEPLSITTPPWYNFAWQYRLPVAISNSSSPLTNYQVLVTLGSTFNFNNAQADGADLRVTTSDGVTEVNFWVESWDSTVQTAYVWVRVPAIPTGSTLIYLYYGNAAAVSVSDGSITFDLFEDTWCPIPGSTGCGPVNPVMSGTQSWWETYSTYPMVFEDTSFAGRPRYHMLYDGHGVIGHAKGYATSADLNTWTEYDGGTPHPPNPNPIMAYPAGYPGAGTYYAWGDTVKVGSTYYMFVSAGPGTCQRVESVDLINWSNFTNLVDDDPGGVIGSGVAVLKEPDGITPVVVDGKYWMVYFRGGSPGTMYMASSPVGGDLGTWSYTGNVFLTPTAGGFDASGLWTPSFIRFGDMYYIYYQGNNGSYWETGYARASAESGGLPIPPDPGVTSWSKSDTDGDGVPDSVLKRGPAGSWDSVYAIDPMVRQFSDGVYYLFYTGTQNNGYATASAPEGPWTKLGGSSGQWNTVAGSPTVSDGILSLTTGVGIRSNPTFQYGAIGFRANFTTGNGLLWGGFINGSQLDRTMIGSSQNQATRLYLKNYVTEEANSLLCDGNCRDAFHVYELMWRAGNSQAAMDHGVASATQASQVPSVALPVTFFSYSGTGGTLAVDWIYIRQYQNPEPTTQTGIAQGLVDLGISKAVSSETIYAGDILTYTLSITNSGLITASAVVVTDTLPVQVSLESISPTQGSCNLENPVVCELGDLSSGGNASIVLVVTAISSGTIENTAIVDSTTVDINPDDNTASVTITVLPSADLWVSQVDSPDPVRVGDLLTYVISVQNGGPSSSSDVTLTDILPTSAQFISASPSAYCGQASPVICTLPGLSVGGSSQVQVVVRPLQDGLITNTISVSSATYDPDLTNNSSEEGTVVATSADLAVVLEDDPDPVIAGEALTYTTQVSNLGPSQAVSTTLTIDLPADTIYLGYEPGTVMCDEETGMVTCFLGDLLSGAQMEITVFSQVSASVLYGSQLTSYAQVLSMVDDPISSNNQDNQSTAVITEADLSIATIDTPDPVAPGTYLTYTLVYENLGPSDAIGLTITDTLPSDVDFIRSVPNVCVPRPQSHIVNCDPSDLAAGQNDQIDVLVMVKTSAASPLLNHVSIGADTLDPNQANNISEEMTNLDSQAPSLEWLYPATNDLQAYELRSMVPGQALTLRVVAQDDGMVDRVRFLRWDHIRLGWIDICVDEEGSTDVFECAWVFRSPLELPDGLNAIYAYAYDEAGNWIRKRIWVLPPRVVLLPVVLK